MPVMAKAQSTFTDTIYFDRDWNRIALKDSASFFRPPIKILDESHYLIEDYYVSGVRQMTEVCADTNADMPDGQSLRYHENGKKEGEMYFVDGIKNGDYAFYHENGQLAESGKYKMGFFDGEIVSYYKNGIVCRMEKYDDGTMKWGKCFTKQGKDTAYYMDRSIPRYPGGDELYEAYILKKMRYPNYCWKHKIKGTVYIEADIDEKGKIYKTQITRSVHPLLDAEALRLIQNMPKWEPAIGEDGKPIKSYRNLDVLFE
jgi:TonB family protein